MKVSILFRHTWPLWLYLLSPHHHTQGLEKGSLKNRFIGTWGTPLPSVKMFEGFFLFFSGIHVIPHNMIKYLIYCTCHIIIKTTMMLYDYVHTVFSSGRGQSNLVLPSVSNTSKTIRHPQIWSGNKSLRHYATSHYRLRSGLVGGGLSYLVSSFAASWFASLTGVWYIRWWVPFFLVSLFYNIEPKLCAWDLLFLSRLDIEVITVSKLLGKTQPPTF